MDRSNTLYAESDEPDAHNPYDNNVTANYRYNFEKYLKTIGLSRDGLYKLSRMTGFSFIARIYNGAELEVIDMIGLSIAIVVIVSLFTIGTLAGRMGVLFGLIGSVISFVLSP